MKDKLLKLFSRWSPHYLLILYEAISKCQQLHVFENGYTIFMKHYCTLLADDLSRITTVLGPELDKTVIDLQLQSGLKEVDERVLFLKML